MKAIIDTNVLLSAAWKDKTPEEVVLWIAAQDDWEWVVSEEILVEYREVLRREKFNLNSETLEKWETIIAKLTTHIEVEIEIEFPRDQKDAKFLACALISGADFFITGDKDFNEAKKIVRTTIISISSFRELFIRQ
ncbi:MAG: putative toxin-antitoxin system toxin component, PIN family [Chloroflexi bacterium]|nr:putative toxin-antitoxin system toxin component, PIN family [Anaerolineales bacterium]NUQ60744.1 putative toxin-antitoxin system toxin component, PIN family [Anaerolineales bacterium]RIK52021.1 MAG: putative toxin-antitoxin system toxin component, PIN family [Chloroflexota bacterium]